MAFVSVDANSVDPDQTAPIGIHCLTKKLLKHFSRQQKQTSLVVIGALRVKFKTIIKVQVSEY